MKNTKPTPEEQKSVTIASKFLADDLTDFMDRVAARLDLYEPKVEPKGKIATAKKEPPAEIPVVEPRPMKHY